MKKVMFIIGFFSAIFFCLHRVMGQEFMASEGMRLFNKGEYDSVRDVLPDWIRAYPSEEGVARYFLAESYYNLGLMEADISVASGYFGNAYSNFESALNDIGFRQRHPEYFYSAQYKKGWCYFRRAELGENSADLMGSAYSCFTDLDTRAPDSLKIMATYMAGESKLREALLKKYVCINSNFSDINDVLKAFQIAKEQFSKVNNVTTAWPLRLCSQIILHDVDYEIGKIFGILPVHVFSIVIDVNKRNTPVETALWYLEQANYSSILKGISTDLSQAASAVINYLEAMRHLSMFLVTGSDSIAQWVDDYLGRLSTPGFQSEINFRSGIKGHKSLIALVPKPQEFADASTKVERYFSQSSQEINEAHYWLGFIQSFSGQAIAQNQLNSFIKSYSGGLVDLRAQALIENATLEIFKYDFERYSSDGNTVNLKQLKTNLDIFIPQNSEVKEERDLLSILLRIILAEDTKDIWASVLRGADIEKLNNALRLIEDILPRAASVTGERREHYLDQLDRLFEITRHQRGNETRFYKGIASALRAEIVSPAERNHAFISAANNLTNIQPPYDLEAKYVRAMCLFFAHSYADSRELFNNLINQNGSIRSLFYLGEIFRQSEPDYESGMAAEKCYKVIISKTSGVTGAEFWLRKAEAGLALSTTAGKADVLRGVHIENVHYPDNLISGMTLSYESLADPKFLLFIKLKKSLEFFQKYGLPKKTIYPSINRLNSSNFLYQQSFSNFTAKIDERRGTIFSGLKLLVLLPENVKSYRVYIGSGELYRDTVGYFRKKNIELNSKDIIKIISDNCYLFLNNHRFSKPGEEVMSISLSKKVNYDSKGKTRGSTDFYQLSRSSLDGNLIIHRSGQQIGEYTQLGRDFSSNIRLRDFIFAEDTFLVVDSEANQVWKYNVNGAKKGKFKLNFKDGLNSPEGIALDSDGNIYIADWGNHRVVVFDDTGGFKYSFGKFGKNDNNNQNKGVKARFVFPTRITVEEDVIGVTETVDNIPIEVFKEKHILVADRYGVHKFDSQGHYLHSPVRAGGDFPEGSFYAIAINGYGVDSNLYVAKRRDGEIIKFSGKAVKK